MNLSDLINILDYRRLKPTDGLPDELFYCISRMTPLVNVDLLIKDDYQRTLLSWRDDDYSGIGWHLPGGIVRFKEKLETRVIKVSETELGTSVDFDPKPIAINQFICKERDTRGHFISLLYRCYLPTDFVPKNDEIDVNEPGFLKWHRSPPDDLLSWHSIYREYI